MSDHLMPAEEVITMLAAFDRHGVAVCVGGGWAVDALVCRQTRPHADLDLWVDARETEGLHAAFVEQGIDRLHPWPGDRPWNVVVHDGGHRRVDLHFYEPLDDGRLHYGSVTAPFLFSEQDLAGEGRIAGAPVRCERPEFALQNHVGYDARDVDRRDVGVLCRHFGFEPPLGFA